jgi:hypothetical protein
MPTMSGAGGGSKTPRKVLLRKGGGYEVLNVVCGLPGDSAEVKDHRRTVRGVGYIQNIHGYTFFRVFVFGDFQELCKVGGDVLVIVITAGGQREV